MTDLRIRFPFLRAVLIGLLSCVPAQAVTTGFFNAAQGTNLVAAGPTSDTIHTAGYLFTYTRDKLFTGGVGLTNPIGRLVRVPWPSGLEAQAVTTGPSPGGAKMTIKRDDGGWFAIQSLTFKLLANTAGAGAALEVMPKLNGEDGRPDPYMYEASGYYGQSFSYLTPELSGFDTYSLSLYVDFAVMTLTVVDDRLPPPVLEFALISAEEALLTWPASYAGFVVEQKSTLAPAAWLPTPEPVSLVGDNYQATISLTNAARFFRLRRGN